MTIAILPHLPHRSPFLLVDRILAREPGLRVLAEKLVTAGDPSAASGPLLLEMLAQAGGFLEESELHGTEIFLAGIQAAEFHGAAHAGDRLELEVRPDAAFGPVARIRGEVRRDGEVLCTALLLLRRGRSA